MKKIGKKIKQEWKNILFNVILVFITTGIVILFYEDILLTTILLIIVSIIWLIKWKSKITLMIFIFGALGGPICEIIAISFGVWNYTFPNLFNIPFWLFILWGDTTAFLYQMVLEIKKLGIKK